MFFDRPSCRSSTRTGGTRQPAGSRPAFTSATNALTMSRADTRLPAAPPETGTLT